MVAHGYHRIREIGVGSFGKAVLVKKDNRYYAMKIVDTSRMSSKERKDAMNEVKVLSALKHPYIVSYRESFMDDARLCIIMDYAEGGDLFKVIDKVRRSYSRLGEEKIVRWMTQAFLALKYLHDKHVLHRDLKSQNIFLTGSGRIKLGDFGISKVLEATNCFARTSIGTPYYLAPEICQQRPYAWSADIWALGCILYELCMLKVPFDAHNFRALCDRITRGPSPKISGSFSTGLRELDAAMLQRDPKQRPSAAQVLQRPVIQGEIRKMLEEEKSKKEKLASEDAEKARKVLSENAKNEPSRPPTPKAEKDKRAEEKRAEEKRVEERCLEEKQNRDPAPRAVGTPRRAPRDPRAAHRDPSPVGRPGEKRPPSAHRGPAYYSPRAQAHYSPAARRQPSPAVRAQGAPPRAPFGGLRY